MKRRFVVCGVLVLAGLWSVAAHAAPVLRVDEVVWNPGIIVSGKTYEKSVTVENVGTDPLDIEKIDECCGFFGQIRGGKRLAPGGKAELVLTLSPFKFVGDFKAELFIITNDPSQPKFSVFALAQVVAANHALAEIKVSEVDLGVINLRDRVPFSVTIGNKGNIPLEVRNVDRTQTISETGYRPEILPGDEKTLTFEFIPGKTGPIEEKIAFSSNDGLNRALEFRVRGYVAKESVSTKAFSIYPIMGGVVYDAVNKVYRYEFTMKNDGPVSIYIPSVECDIDKVRLEFDNYISPGKSSEFKMLIPLNQVKQGTYHVNLQLRLPFEIQ